MRLDDPARRFAPHSFLAVDFSVRSFIREREADGASVSEWELGCVSGRAIAPDLTDFEALSALASLAIPMHGALRRIQLVLSKRRPLLWYRGVRRAIEVIAFIGGAVLLSYLVLQPRW
jgi:hypothetical protein